MRALAFAASPLFSSRSEYYGHCLQSAKTIPIYYAKRPVAFKRWHASSNSDPEQGGTTPDDDALSLELRKKVNELFGSRQNVTIELEADSNVQFKVRKREIEDEYRQTQAAWSVIRSIVALSVAAVIAFIALYSTGAVHGSPNERRYDMPTFGKSSYIDPYELLEEDQELQENQVLPDW